MGIFWQHEPQQFFAAGEILLAAPIGFTLSLLVDRHKAPLNHVYRCPKFVCDVVIFLFPTEHFLASPVANQWYFLLKNAARCFGSGSH